MTQQPNKKLTLADMTMEVVELIASRVDANPELALQVIRNAEFAVIADMIRQQPELKDALIRNFIDAKKVILEKIQINPIWTK